MEKRTRLGIQLREASAFTLIEIITVVAIIVILGALIFPVAKGMLDNGKQAGCISNLRQWAVLANTYSGEHNGSFPQAWTQVSNGKISWNHYDAAMPSQMRTGGEGSDLIRWRRGSSINGCPQHGNTPYGSGGYSYRYYSYAINWHLTDPALSIFRGKPAGVERPSRTIFITETAQNLPQTGFYNANYQTVLGYDHREKTHALFVDGHIESMSKIALENVLP